jgi:CxxC motif-containing protein (DUF1111 family)
MAESPETEIRQVQRLLDPTRPRIRSRFGRPVGSGDLRLVISHRNPPPLFGAGAIDAITEEALAAAAAGQPRDVRGRVNRQPGGRIGRFGWKAQVATLREFVLTACATELGLEVPGHHQAGSPLDPGGTAPGLDLTGQECNDLIAFVRGLPVPTGEVRAESASLGVEAGRRRFREAGCADCHVPALGPIRGIYSDLLLHDMGRELSDDANYFGTSANENAGGATGLEWRTPPLWGYRDTGPYLHDGRAGSLDETVAFHGGQGAAAARRYFALQQGERLEIQVFLRSLVAPPVGGP